MYAARHIILTAFVLEIAAPTSRSPQHGRRGLVLVEMCPVQGATLHNILACLFREMWFNVVFTYTPYMSHAHKWSK